MDMFPEQLGRCPTCDHMLTYSVLERPKVAIVVCTMAQSCSYARFFDGPEIDWEDYAVHPMYLNTELSCAWCDAGSLRMKKGKYGWFYGCTKYPKCRFTKNA